MEDANNIISGVVSIGLGEGAYFISMPHYKNEIRKKLGFDAYPGTLNLKVEGNQINLLKKNKPIKINGIKKNNRIFGQVDCYRAKINNINGSIIIPHLTKHKNIIEFIAPVHLKTKLRLKNGDKIKIYLLQ